MVTFWVSGTRTRTRTSRFSLTEDLRLSYATGLQTNFVDFFAKKALDFRSASVVAYEVTAAAEEKAEVAAMAASAAKRVSCVCFCKERCLRKNKLKKHVPVKLLKIHKDEKHRSLSSLEKTRVSSGGVVWEGIPPSTCDRNAEAGEVDSRGSIQEEECIDKDDKAS
ncbi:hypothetical protein HHK36_010463 [Tetracentron sinense]|uniref:Uncharacterized protein n=1 Tax=Tetracentron sinense TaxID=13715 RepID=A0A835DJ93_TETSI|nr:hypothetical protein HHK36_010463 [Tetracentron sinense]